MSSLRFITYLTPSLPAALFDAVAVYLGRATGMPTTLCFETRVSAPSPDEVDPFSADVTDLGFLCSPGYIWLRDRNPSPITLGGAPVFDDPRNRGEPVYFSDIVVSQNSSATKFEDLREGTWAFNDLCSWSGYLNLVARLGKTRRSRPIEGLRESGSHLESVRMVAHGIVDAAAVDSNVLALLLRREPGLASRVRVVDSWGPHPIQPMVMSTRLASDLRLQLGKALFAMHEDPAWANVLRSCGVERFVPVHDEDYETERGIVRRLSRPAQTVSCRTTFPESTHEWRGE